MLGIERNEYGYPIFDNGFVDRDRRGIREFLERFARQCTRGGGVSDECLADWERHWIDIGGEG